MAIARTKNWKLEYNIVEEVIMEVNKLNIEICALADIKKKRKGNTRYQNYILFYNGKVKIQRA